jgi:hypothetical protein
MNVGIGTVAAQFLFWEYFLVSNFRYCVFAKSSDLDLFNHLGFIKSVMLGTGRQASDRSSGLRQIVRLRTGHRLKTSRQTWDRSSGLGQVVRLRTSQA